jgi:hypothetical protein
VKNGAQVDLSLTARLWQGGRTVLKAILCFLLLTGADGYAQGLVGFANNSASRVTNGLTSEPVVAGTTFKASLYFLPATSSLDEPPPTTADFDTAGVVLGPHPPASFYAPGIFGGGDLTVLTQPGWFGWFQVRSWETAFGDTYEAAIANTEPISGRLALAGTSNIMRFPVGNPAFGPIPYLYNVGLQGFSLQVVPEPPVGWLLILAAGGALLRFLRAQPRAQTSSVRPCL